MGEKEQEGKREIGDGWEGEKKKREGGKGVSRGERGREKNGGEKGMGILGRGSNQSSRHAYSTN